MDDLSSGTAEGTARRFGTRAALLTVLALAAGGTAAQDWPSRPIRFLVASPPGGSPDILARAVAQKLAESLGQQVVVDNRSGASGIIGAEMAARANPDGHTLLLMTTTLGATLPNLKRRLPYDVDRDFVHVTRIATVDNVLVVHPSVPAKSVAELVRHAKARSEALTFASAGNGSPAHLAGAMFNVLAGTRMTHVPYKGAGPAMTDLVGGQVQVMITSPLVAMPQVTTGRLRALATSGSARNPAIPDLPPISETIPGYEIVQWWGLSVAAKTPRAIVGRLHAETTRVLNAPDVRARIAEQGGVASATTPEAFSALIAAERKRMAAIIRQADIPVED